MGRLLTAGVGLLAAFALLGPAMAADIAVKPKRERATAPQRTTQTQQSSNWSGGQAGGSNGGSSVNNNFVEPGAYNVFDCGSPVGTGGCFETPFEFKQNKVSYIIGPFIGYRVQIGNMVVGVEGDIYWQSAETSKVQNTPPPWLSEETFTGSLKLGTNGSVRGRIGTLVTPWTMIYATAGIAIAEIKGSFSYYSVGDSSGIIVQGASTWSDTRIGGTVGGGVETEILPGIKARGEYRFSHYGSWSKDVPLTNNSGGTCDPSFCGTTAHIDLRLYDHKFTFGLGFDIPGL
jgi:outer membrane immunogenic protein